MTVFCALTFPYDRLEERVVASFNGQTKTGSSPQELQIDAMLEDPAHMPVGLASHGAMGKDVYTIDFNQTSHAWETNNPKAFIVDCDDGGNHVDTMPRTAMAPAAIQMLWDHPFGVSPEPYATGLPSGWPTDCVPPPVPASH